MKVTIFIQFKTLKKAIMMKKLIGSILIASGLAFAVADVSFGQALPLDEDFTFTADVQNDCEVTAIDNDGVLDLDPSSPPTLTTEFGVGERGSLTIECTSGNAQVQAGPLNPNNQTATDFQASSDFASSQLVVRDDTDTVISQSTTSANGAVATVSGTVDLTVGADVFATSNGAFPSGTYEYIGTVFLTAP